MKYKCSTCGATHEDLPDVGFDKPDYWFSIPENERERRCKFTPDTCVIDDEHHFVRGVIHIPVHGYAHDFGLGAWASLKRENFQIYLANFDTDKIGPFFGWLCTAINYYPPIENVKTMVHFRGNHQRPKIVLEPTDYILAVAQRDGISLDEAYRIVHHYLPTLQHDNQSERSDENSFLRKIVGAFGQFQRK